MKITKPGLYYDLNEGVYRAQREWLSVSGIKKLLPPSVPAKFKASLSAEEDHKPQYDIGKAFHAEVLGDGAEVVVWGGEAWRSAEAREFRAAAYAAGQVPILAADKLVIEQMTASLNAHDVAPHLFKGGAAEVSAFWRDPDTGVQCKARFDYLPDKQPGRRLIVPDLKSAVSADPNEFSRAAARYFYVGQQLHYSNALRVLGVDPDPAFLFVVVEKEEPFLVNVGQFVSHDDQRLSAAALDHGIRLYRDCLAADQWPGWRGVTDLNLPKWHLYDLEELTA